MEVLLSYKYFQAYIDSFSALYISTDICFQKEKTNFN